MGTPKHITEPHGEQKVLNRIPRSTATVHGPESDRNWYDRKFITTYCRIVESILPDKDKIRTKIVKGIKLHHIIAILTSMTATEYKKLTN